MNDDLTDWLNRQLAAKQRAFSNGNLGALKDAVFYCSKYQHPLPNWANVALLELLSDLHSGDPNKAKANKAKAKQRGRHTRWIRQYQQDMIDMERAETVTECREKGNIAWADVYEAASAILEGSVSEGSAATIEKSYKRYKIRSEAEPYRYHVLRSITIIKPFNKPKSSNNKTWEYVLSLSKEK